MNTRDCKRPIFKQGQVVTVEPGLYYPGLGGRRALVRGMSHVLAPNHTLASRICWPPRFLRERGIGESTERTLPTLRLKLETHLRQGCSIHRVRHHPLVASHWRSADYRLMGAVSGQRRFQKWGEVRASSNITGAEAAREILQAAQISDVQVVETNDFLGDHYDPTQQTALPVDERLQHTVGRGARHRGARDRPRHSARESVRAVEGADGRSCR